jgi:glycosyltransferase involved in cell wall biosynthesis/SAM-dependent methyltransferase
MDVFVVTEQKKLLVWICWKDIRHPEAGGAELVHHEISKRLVCDGWNVVHLVPGFGGCTGEEVVDGIHVIRVGQSILSFYRLPFYFWRHLRKQTSFLVDAFISVGSFSCLMMKPSRAAIVIHHIEDIKWFFQTSFYGVPRWVMPIMNLTGYFVEKLQLILLALAFRGTVMTGSESTAHELRRLGFRRKRIAIISYGITSKPLEELSQSVAKEKVFTVLMLGPRRSKKPLETLRAFELFQQRHPEAQFWVAGWGEKLEAMRRYVEKHGMRNVTFHGRVSSELRDELLQRTHVLCTTPLREGWGLIVIEANAMGTPVIGYDVPGLRDALAFGNGWLCAPKPCKMGEQLETVWAQWRAGDGAYEQVRGRCLEAGKRFTFDRSYEQFKEIMKHSAESAPAAGASRDQAEFDRFAGDYESVHNRYLPPGASSRDFVTQKAETADQWAKTCFQGKSGLSVLDFGCGTGRVLAVVADSAWCGSLAGVDESLASLDTVRQAFKDKSKPVVLGRSLQELSPGSRYDFVFMFNVLHHILPADRLRLVRQAVAALRDEGVVAVWEHNPCNPLTRLLVALSPMDKHAHLISRRQVVHLMRQAGLECVGHRFVNSFPPRLAKLPGIRWVENALSGLPVGAQYWSLFRVSTGKDVTTP